MCARFVCALQESVSPVLCKFWQPYGWLMATSYKKVYAIPRFTAPRAPAPAAIHCWPIPPQKTHKHSSVSVSVGSLGPGAHTVWALSLVGMGFDSKCDFTLSTSLLGLLLCPWTLGIFSESFQCCTAAAPVPAVLLGLLCPWMWGISSQSLQHWAADMGYLLTATQPPCSHCSRATRHIEDS